MSALADVAAAIADRTRARMLEELLAGPPLPAGALAVRVGVAPSTVSGHLARLEAAGLVTIDVGRPPPRGAARRPARRRGARGAAAPRRRRPAPDRPARRQRPRGAARGPLLLRPPRRPRGRRARRRPARPRRTDRTHFTVPDGAAGYYREAFGVDIASLPGRRPLVRACTDWTERRPHVAGALGAALLDSMLARGWLARRPDGRALNVTARGRDALGSVVAAPANGGW